MSPYARRVLAETAARYGVEPDVLVGHRHPRRLLAARIEVAKALQARGYNGPRIAAVMHRDHSTVAFYLGQLATKRPSPRSLTQRPLAAPPPPKPRPVTPPGERRLIRYAGQDT